MLEYAGSQRSGLQAQRAEGVALVSVLRSLDWILLAGVAALVGVGLWAVAGVTRFDNPGHPSYYLDRQIVYAAVGGFGLIVAIVIDPDVYRRYWRAIFGGTVGLIAIVFVLGSAARGSTRWINVGFFTFQPSEFGKLLFVLAIAGFLAERGRSARRGRERRCALSASARSRSCSCSSQPDLGTALVYLAALGAMLFVCRNAVEAPDGPRLDRRARRRRRALGGAGGRRRLPQDVPEAAPHLFHASGDMPASTLATTSSSRSPPSARVR